MDLDYYTNTTCVDKPLDYCYYYHTDGDLRAEKCDRCVSSFFYNNDSRVCEPPFTGIDGACALGYSLSNKFFCHTCFSGWYYQQSTGNCSQTCEPGQLPLKILDAVIDDNEMEFLPAAHICFNAPDGCLSGEFTDIQEFNCTQCDTGNGFTKYQLSDLGCMNLICNNNFMSINKPCNPVASPTTCDPNLCFKLDEPDECLNNVCQWKIFSLVFSG